MDTYKIDLLLKFVLAAAGQEDFDNRLLGPIHLIKFVYLADLEFSKYHNGKTFTGTKWKFHHYGPWAIEVYKRIEPVILETGAEEKKFSHPKYEDDFARYILQDEDLYLQLERDLPFEITSVIKKAVHRFGSDTQSLLHYVYNTEPMLKAAPGEILSFEDLRSTHYLEEATTPKEQILTAKAKKKRKEKIRTIKEKVRKRLTQKTTSKKLIPLPTPPRYDKVFLEGQKWLDELAGEPIGEESGLLVVSDDFWKSPARFDPDVS